MKSLFYFDLTLDNPVIKGHSVDNRSILPGMAYIDILYQLIKQNLGLDFTQYTVKQMMIFNPLVIKNKNTSRIQFTFEKKNNYYEIKAEDSDTKDPQKKVYITAELYPEPELLTNHININVLKKKAINKNNMDFIYRRAADSGLVHKGMMKTQGTIYYLADNYLLHIQIDKTFQNQNENYLVHPALVDGSVAASLILAHVLKQDDNKNLYIPLSYESFHCNTMIRNECYIIVPHSSIQHKNEIIILDMNFYNAQGEPVAVIKGLTAKQMQHSKDIKIKKPEKIVTGKGIKSSSSESHIVKPLKKMFSKYIKKDAEQIDMETGFFDLGLESSHLLSLVKDIETTFHIKISPSLLFEYNNLSDLVAYLRKNVKVNYPIYENNDKELYAVKTDGSAEVSSGEANNRYVPVEFEYNENESYFRNYTQSGKSVFSPEMFVSLAIEGFYKNNTLSDPLEFLNISFFSGQIILDTYDTVSVQIDFTGSDTPYNFKADYEKNRSGRKEPCIKGIAKQIHKPEARTININSAIKDSKAFNKKNITEFYEGIKNIKIKPELRIIESVYALDERTIIGKVTLDNEIHKGGMSVLKLNPLLLNTCFLLSYPNIFMSFKIDNDVDLLFVPSKIEKVRLYKNIAEKVYIVRKIRNVSQEYISFDAIIVGEAGDIQAEIINAEIKIIEKNVLLIEKSTLYNQQDTPYRKIEPMDIAIIGISGKYPGAKDIDEFWENLKSGKDCITEIPSDRWNWRDYFDPEKNIPGKSYSKWGGFIDGIDEFDPLFFNITPYEAAKIDPQERLFLECAYSTIEDAGYTRGTIGFDTAERENKVGVFVGVMYEEFQLLGVQQQAAGGTLSLGGLASSIANRVSYTFNFHGPSMAIDTACSSSLMAIHLACQAILQGECLAAIAGGVNVSMHPNKYIMLSQANFVSSKGLCESFGTGGDGYVPGEGVGAILLKPLSQAVRDGDYIYGVIKGSAVNSGGKTSGYTVPSPQAQAKVIKEAIKNSGVNARAMSYIEAHGTGTSLGDPIEITGITKAFRHFTADNEFCFIGSVKSNIGHCEGAAGIAGVTKILLQLKHKQLVPSLHSSELNPNIDFKSTPFIVQQGLSDWKSETPRIAGISSFGAGGTNVHIVFEEYVEQGIDSEKINIPVDSKNPVIIILSAADKDRLNDRVRDLLGAVKRGAYGDNELRRIAYTLQTGRESMEERLGFITSSVTELTENLGKFLSGDYMINGLFFGKAKKNDDIISLFSNNEELDEMINKWIQRKKYEKLIELWVKGFSFDWKKLYGGRVPKKIILPVYPFAREKYWPEELLGGSIIRNNYNKILHPLVHSNTSTLAEQRYTSSFSGNEFFLSDHKVNKQKILPGVAYLEMARVAVKNALEIPTDSEEEIILKNVTWIRPAIAGDEQLIITIGLFPDPDDSIYFQIYSENEEKEKIIHCQGSVIINAKAEEDLYIDIDTLKNQGWEKELSSEDCYAVFEAMGLSYGPAHRGINIVYADKEKSLVKILVSDSVMKNRNEYVLHPAVMDASFQATIGIMGDAARDKAVMPFSLDTVYIKDRCEQSMWALVRYSENEENNLDIDVCNDKGKICISLQGLLLREITVKKRDVSMSLDDLLAQVKEGSLDVEAADSLLSSIHNE